MAYYTFKKYENENKTTVMIFCTGQACLPVHVLWWEWWQVHTAQDVHGAELSGDQPVRGVQGARGGPRLRVQCRQRWPLPQDCVGGSCSKHVFVVITVAEVGTGHNKEPIRNGNALILKLVGLWRGLSRGLSRGPSSTFGKFGFLIIHLPHVKR